MDTIGSSITILHFYTTLSIDVITLGVKKGVAFSSFHSFSLLNSTIPCFAPNEKTERKTTETFIRPAGKQHKPTPQTPEHQENRPQKHQKNTRETNPEKTDP
jgi:hypothetical protein